VTKTEETTEKPKDREPGEPLTLTCTHPIEEDCLNCSDCDQCAEDVNEDGVCASCVIKRCARNATRGQLALSLYCSLETEGVESPLDEGFALADMLSDLMHFAAAREAADPAAPSFDDELTLARNHFSVETNKTSYLAIPDSTPTKPSTT
jgi:hypothetical protein